jgi:hypothetical protein
MIPLSAKLAGSAALVACLTLLTLWRVEAGRADRLAGRLETTRADLSQCRENTAALEASQRPKIGPYKRFVMKGRHG